MRFCECTGSSGPFPTGGKGASQADARTRLHDPNVIPRLDGRIGPFHMLRKDIALPIHLGSEDNLAQSLVFIEKINGSFGK